MEIKKEGEKERERKWEQCCGMDRTKLTQNIHCFSIQHRTWHIFTFRCSQFALKFFVINFNFYYFVILCFGGFFCWVSVTHSMEFSQNRKSEIWYFCEWRLWTWPFLNMGNFELEAFNLFVDRIRDAASFDSNC